VGKWLVWQIICEQREYNMKCVEIVGAITDIEYISLCFGPLFSLRL